MSVKRLLLLRHATASSSSEGGDKDRHLTPQGKADAKVLGQFMMEQGYMPDVILCSSAMRTRQTLEALNNHLGIENIDLRDDIYSGSTGDYLYYLQNVSEDHNTVMLIAHNPSISELVRLLAAQGQDRILTKLSEGYAPATLSVIDCACEKWAHLNPVENTLVDYLSPLDYNAPPRPTRWM